ncbi:MAG: OadG family protein [Campylobacterales bacterium]|nr:OadG family protein [Campylobacterales bacterium]
MAEVNLLAESVKFMLLGMGVVYLFLYIVILAVKLQAYLINKYFPETTPASTAKKPAPSRTDEDEKARIAAIVAAVNEFCKNKS